MLEKLPKFTLFSTDIADGEQLQTAQLSVRLGGQDLSPYLSWSDFPEQTKSFAVTVYDPDAPTPSRSITSFIGAAPPVGTGKHRYFFVVYALDTEKLDLSPDATPAFLTFNLLSRTLAWASINSWYEQV